MHGHSYLDKNSEGIKSENEFIRAGILLLAIVWFCINSISYVKHSSLERNGNYTSGEIVKKVPDASGKYRYFYLNYQYENTQASNNCAKTGSHFTTPKDKACKVSIQSHRVTEKEYNSFQRGDIVEVLYLKSDEKTRSVLPEMTFNKKRLIIINAGLLFVIFLLGRRFLSYLI